MRVYIVRHGKAIDPDLVGHRVGGKPLTDFDRELTSRGEAQAAFLAERLLRSNHKPQSILSSRFPRAIATARTIQEALGCPLTTEFGLETDHAVGEALEMIERAYAEGCRSLMLVGHNPQLGELIAVLASGLPPQDMILKTGELVALEVRPQQMIGTSRIVGRLRLRADKNEESIVGGVFAISGAE